MGRRDGHRRGSGPLSSGRETGLLTPSDPSRGSLGKGQEEVSFLLGVVVFRGEDGGPSQIPKVDPS